MAHKPKKTMREAFGGELRSTSGMGGQAAAYLEWAFRELKERIENRKRQKQDGTITIELDKQEYYNLLDGLDRAGESGIIINKYEKEADEASYQIFKKRNALKALPKKGAKLKDFKEVVKRLEGELPKRGRRETFNPKEVTQYHCECIDNIKEDKGIKILETKHKEQAVRLVQDRFSFQSYEATHKYLTRQKAKNLPFKR